MKRPRYETGIALLLGCWVLGVMALYAAQYRGIIGIVLHKFGLS